MARMPALGVCYYPEHWPEHEWADHAQRMREIGILYVRIGEFAWSRLEPSPGDLQLDWLRRAMDTLGDAGLKIVLGTPTATPPKWLVDSMPDMIAVDENGQPRGFGSRRHYDFSHLGYRKECARITEILAREFGTHPALEVWQTDNEYGCHDTILSFSAGQPNSAHQSAAALHGFRAWLKERYGSIDALNEAWGNVFWSMEYRDFDEIDLPNLTVTESNPSHRMAFRRYSSDQVVAFNKVQVDIIRKHSPGRDIVHNFMGMFTEFDHFDVGADLDISSWDSYPLGFLERRRDIDDDHRAKYYQQGDPDFQAFTHDLYRATSGGRWWVMEQQPGPVNWARWNPAPLPGMVRLWSWEAFAHGAEVVSYFRYRQAPFAQEQMHAGLHLPDGTPDIGAIEAAQVHRELESLDLSVSRKSSNVAMVFDYNSVWMTQIQPQGEDYNPLTMVLHFYSAARALGLSLDIRAPGQDLSDYDLVLVPNLLHVSEAAASAFKNTNAQLVFGPRTGAKTVDLTIPDNLPPGALADVVPIRVTRVESLRPGIERAAGNYSISKWQEHIECQQSPIAQLDVDAGGHAYLRFANDSGEGGSTYFGGWPSEALIRDVLADVAQQAGIAVTEMPEDVRQREMGDLLVVVNYSTASKPLPASVQGLNMVLGEGEGIGPAGVRIFKR